MAKRWGTTLPGTWTWYRTGRHAKDVDATDGGRLIAQGQVTKWCQWGFSEGTQCMLWQLHFFILFCLIFSWHPWHILTWCFVGSWLLWIGFQRDSEGLKFQRLGYTRFLSHFANYCSSQSVYLWKIPSGRIIICCALRMNLLWHPEVSHESHWNRCACAFLFWRKELGTQLLQRIWLLGASSHKKLSQCPKHNAQAGS
jgi:hypothetical protein